jgi:hypothetical protein
MRETKLNRQSDDVNDYLKAIFKESSFSINSASEHSYEFKLKIDKSEVNGFVHKDDFDAHSVKHMFNWINQALMESWKQRNMEWI